MAPDTIDPSVMPVAELVAGVVANDDQALSELFRRYRKGLNWLARQQGVSDHDAEDVAQESMIDAILQIQVGGIQCPQALTGYLRTICIRKAVNFRLKSRKYDSYDASPLLAANVQLKDDTGDSERKLMIKERADICRKALEQLKPKERELLTRFYLEEQSQEQIMREMKLSVTQFRLNKSRAKQMFGKAGKRLLDGSRKRLMGGLLRAA
jgi:RNA polymerase sigma-70 factor (ECF subfamily)